ncbi:MAG: response regulator transcription factor [Dehalococcoidia bacterium]
MRLLIVEDESALAIPLARGLSRESYAVDVAGDGGQALKLVAANEYDLVILDLNLPVLDGLSVLQQLKADRPELLVMALTARSAPQQRVSGLDLGADDYLVKPFDYGELRARIRALLRRDMRSRELALTAGDLKLDPAGHTVWQGRRRMELTRKEFSILEFLIRHPGEVVSQEELLEHVWNDDVNPFTNVVRTHINSLRRKLRDSPRTPRYITTVVGRGYRLEGGRD